MSFLSRLLGNSAPHPSFDDCYDDHDLRAARDAAVTGQWEPVRALLESTGVDWDRRGHRCNVLAITAASHPDWLRSWRAAEPDSADALVVLAWAEVHRAWLARGGKLAKYTPDEAFRAFFQILREAEEACQRAVEVAADDPTPWVARLWWAIGRQKPPEVFGEYWRELQARDPANRHGHNAALQYWCEKWQGSHEQMYEFARTAAEGAPDGSPLALMPLQAHIEYALREEPKGPAGAQRAAELWGRPDVQADIAAAVRGWRPTTDTGAPSHALAIHDHSVLAYVFVHAGMWPQANEQFRVMSEFAYDYPWYYLGDGQRQFLSARRRAQRHG